MCFIPCTRICCVVICKCWNIRSNNYDECSHHPTSFLKCWLIHWNVLEVQFHPNPPVARTPPTHGTNMEHKKHLKHATHVTINNIITKTNNTCAQHDTITTQHMLKNEHWVFTHDNILNNLECCVNDFQNYLRNLYEMPHHFKMCFTRWIIRWVTCFILCIFPKLRSIQPNTFYEHRQKHETNMEYKITYNMNHMPYMKRMNIWHIWETRII